MHPRQKVKTKRVYFLLLGAFFLASVLLGAYGTNKKKNWVPFVGVGSIGCLRHKQKKELGAYGTNKKKNWVPTAQTRKRKKRYFLLNFTQI